jgi:hypothetical protein
LSVDKVTGKKQSMHRNAQGVVAQMKDEKNSERKPLK